MNKKKQIHFKGRFNEDLFRFTGSFDSIFDPHYCGITYPDESYEIYNPSSVSYTLEYIYSGKGLIYIDETPVELTAGDVYIMHAFKHHHYISDKKDPWHKTFIVLDGTLVGGMLSHFQLSHTNYIKGFNNPNYIEKIIEIAKNESSRHSYELFSVFCDFLNALSESKKSHEIENTAYTLKRFVDNNIDKKLTLDEIGKNNGYSISQICRIFKEEFEISIYDYILNKKLLLAKKYLTKTNLPIGDLAYRLNFNSTHHFSNFIKKQTGFTPTQIRNGALD